MVLQCINGVGFKSRGGKNKNLTALKSNSNTVWFNFQTYIYIIVNKGHSREPENVPFMSSCLLCTVALYIQVEIICTLH